MSRKSALSLLLQSANSLAVAEESVAIGIRAGDEDATRCREGKERIFVLQEDDPLSRELERGLAVRGREEGRLRAFEVDLGRLEETEAELREEDRTDRGIDPIVGAAALLDAFTKRFQNPVRACACRGPPRRSGRRLPSEWARRGGWSGVARCPSSR